MLRVLQLVLLKYDFCRLTQIQSIYESTNISLCMLYTLGDAVITSGQLSWGLTVETVQ